MAGSWHGIANILRTTLLDRLLLDSDLPLLDDLLAQLEEGVDALFLRAQVLANEVPSEFILSPQALNLILCINEPQTFLLVLNPPRDRLGMLFLFDRFKLLFQLSIQSCSK